MESLYKRLIEEELVSDIREQIMSNLKSIGLLIKEYIYSDSIYKKEILEELYEEFNSLIVILDDYNFTYEPEIEPDVEEDTFISILKKFYKQLDYFYEKLDGDLLEAFNSQIRYLTNLIEVHRTNFIK